MNWMSESRDLDGQGEKRCCRFCTLKTPQRGAFEMKWDSPWGVGFPRVGTSECTAMSSKYLGNSIWTFHGGGMDLMFPASWMWDRAGETPCKSQGSSPLPGCITTWSPSTDRRWASLWEISLPLKSYSTGKPQTSGTGLIARWRFG